MNGERKVLSLLEVTRQIQYTLNEQFTAPLWIRAEMNKLNLYPQSGHCYPELLEKQNGKIIAQMRANLWRDDYTRINAAFLRILREPLKDGINIMFLAKVSFDPVYGLSLRIMDIDPSFSLGELEKEKLLTIEKLQKEGIFDRNRKLSLPLLPQRIAIISADTSKGLADFSKVIDNNPWGYRYFCMLFPALLQGDQAAGQIIAQLDRIRKVKHHFDVVAIIRGGGGDIGLSCYNNYDLAGTIARFPIPVMTGIGHSTNETVSEMVAYINAITPTELADFLIQRFHNFSVPVGKAAEMLQKRGMQLLSDHLSLFNGTLRVFRSAALGRLNKGNHDLEAMRGKLANAARNCFIIAGKEIHLAEQKITLMDPVNILKRGYSITMKDGKSVKDPSALADGDVIETRLLGGNVKSIVYKP